MNDDERIKKAAEMDLAFRSGEITRATPEQLEQWLDVLCTGNVPNEMVRHREIIRGLTINHLQMARMIRELEDTMAGLNSANDKTQKRITVLTVIAVIVGTIQAVAAVISILH